MDFSLTVNFYLWIKGLHLLFLEMDAIIQRMLFRYHYKFISIVITGSCSGIDSMGNSSQINDK